jgi:sec-independent protein translocase protein TatA
MPPVGPTELILILGIVVLIFGAGRLSEVGGALGRSIREFRDATGVGRADAAVLDSPDRVQHCRRCDSALHHGARFCGSCGTALRTEGDGAL